MVHDDAIVHVHVARRHDEEPRLHQHDDQHENVGSGHDGHDGVSQDASCRDDEKRTLRVDDENAFGHDEHEDAELTYQRTRNLSGSRPPQVRSFNYGGCSSSGHSWHAGEALTQA